MLKSGGAAAVTVNAYVAEWVSVPLVPVTVTVYAPVGVLAVVVIVSVLVNVGLPLVGLTPTVSPVAVGETEAERLTDCVVPLTSETVTVAVALLPAATDPLFGLILTEKSKGPDAANAATCPMTVFHVSKPDDARYSPASQKVDAAVAVGSVAAPK
jgi:hypothetical protein